MAFDVSGLPAYTEQDATSMVAKTLFKPKTAALIHAEGIVMTGVKSSETINIMDTDVVFQAGGTCGFTSSGSTAFTQRAVTVGKIKVQEALCPKDHEAKFTQKALRPGSLTEYNTEVYAQEYTDLKIGKTAEALEVAIWQGDTASGTANLARFDGLIKLIDAASGVVEVTPAGAITKANAIAVIAAVYAAIPAALLDHPDLVIFMGTAEYRNYKSALIEGNFFHYDGKDADGVLRMPGTDIRIISTPGLSGLNRVFALRLSNIALGTDMENEEEKFELYFAKEADQVRYNSEFKYGVNVAFPAEITSYAAA